MSGKSRVLLIIAVAGFMALVSPKITHADPIVFTVTPSVLPGSGSIAPFQAAFISFSYNSLVDQTATGGVGTFTEQGVATATGFLNSLSQAINGTGLNFGEGLGGYSLYATFSGAGTVQPDLASGGILATFTSFSINLYADPNEDTTFANFNSLFGAPPDNTCTAVNAGNTCVTGGTTDDVQVGTSTGFVSGQAHAFGTQANGDFDVLVTFNPVGGFFSGPFTLNLTLADVNGNNQAFNVPGCTTQPCPADLGSFTDATIAGNGDMFFLSAVPEPSSFLLLGTGLIGLGAAIRKRLRNR